MAYALRKKPEITAAATIARTRLFQVEQVGLRFANGREVAYERLRGSDHGAVLVVPLLDADTMLLIREYAVGVERYELAFPKGRIEAGETPETAGGREIMEEIGYGARELRRLKSLTLAPGCFAHTTHVVLARDLYPAHLEGDEPEPIEVVPWSLARLPELLARDDFSEARSITALYLALEVLRRAG